MTGKFASRIDFVPGSWKEGMAMLAPFAWFAICFYGFYRLTFYLLASGLVKPGGINMVPFLVVFWLLGFSLFAFDFVKGPPRWFMPYIGLLLPIFNLFIYNGLIIPNWSDTPILLNLNLFLGGIIDQGFIWVGLFFLIILLVITTRFIPKFRLFHQRLRDDWTLLSFIAYGTVPFTVIYSYGDYEMDFANQGPYLFLVALIFAAGGWFYLRASTPLKKILPLFVAMALSMFVAEVSRGILYEFPPGLQLPWQAKLMDSIVMWIWAALFLLFPILVKWLPGVSTPSKLPLNEG
jgi:hypothetical protein